MHGPGSVASITFHFTIPYILQLHLMFTDPTLPFAALKILQLHFVPPHFTFCGQTTPILNTGHA